MVASRYNVSTFKMCQSYAKEIVKEKGRDNQDDRYREGWLVIREHCGFGFTIAHRVPASNNEGGQCESDFTELAHWSVHS